MTQLSTGDPHLKGNYTSFIHKAYFCITWKKSDIKPFVAPEVAACNLLKYIKGCHSVA